MRSRADGARNEARLPVVSVWISGPRTSFLGQIVTPPPHTEVMNTQLVLIEDVPPDWYLADETREIGRQGVRDARQALALAADPAPEADDTTPHRHADQAA
jgi:hypothetical protein